MKTKVIKSGDKNFEEEKAKMLEIPTSDMQEAKKGLNKEDQLRLVFKKMITNFLNSDFDVENYYNTQDGDIEVLANNLLLEVKIRVKL